MTFDEFDRSPLEVETDPTPLTHRRDFVRSLALGAAATATVVLPLSQPAEADEPKVEAKKADKPAEPAKKADPTEADARMDLVLARFGKHKQLDDKAKATIRAEIAGLVHRAEALRKLPISNGEGPFPVFQAYRAPLS